MLAIQSVRKLYFYQRTPSLAERLAANCGALPHTPQGLSALDLTKGQKRPLESPFVGLTGFLLHLCHKAFWTLGIYSRNAADHSRNGKQQELFQLGSFSESRSSGCDKNGKYYDTAEQTLGDPTLAAEFSA